MVKRNRKRNARARNTEQENSLSAEDKLLIYFKAAMAISSISVIVSLAVSGLIIPAIVIASLVGGGYLTTKALTSNKPAKVYIKEEEITKDGEKEATKDLEEKKEIITNKSQEHPPISTNKELKFEKLSDIPEVFIKKANSGKLQDFSRIMDEKESSR